MRFLRNRPLIVTIVVLVLLVAIVSSGAAGTMLADGISAVGGFLVPAQTVLYQAGEVLTGGAPSAVHATDDVTITSGSSPSSIMDYEELVAENERLRAMLDYKESNVTQELKVAQITGKEPGNWFEVFTINIGANDGIAEGMPVMTPSGLVGKVAEVNLNSAKVITIIDARSSVSAITERTRDTGVVKGTIGSDDLTATLTMNYLPLDTDVIDGDVVLTSGYDEVYPKGLIIGTVTNTVDQSGGKRVTVQPGVDFRRLEEVMVVVRTENEPANAVSYEVAGAGGGLQPDVSASPAVAEDLQEAISGDIEAEPANTPQTPAVVTEPEPATPAPTTNPYVIPPSAARDEDGTEN